MRLDPGEKAQTRGTTAADNPRLNGTVVDDRVADFEDPDTGVSGKVQLRGLRSDAGGTVVSYRVLELTDGVLDSVTCVFPGEHGSLDADFRVDGVGDLGPSVVQRSEPSISSTEVTFVFDPAMAAGQSSLAMHTDSPGSETVDSEGQLILRGTSKAGGWTAVVASLAPKPVSPAPPPPPADAIGPVTAAVDLGERVGNVLLADTPQGLAVVSHTEGVLMVRWFDVSTRPRPTETSRLVFPDPDSRFLPDEASSNGALLYLVVRANVGRRATLMVFDCGAGKEPILLAQLPLDHSGPWWGFAQTRDRLWLPPGLLPIDVSNPMHPREMQPITTVPGWNLIDNSWMQGDGLSLVFTSVILRGEQQPNAIYMLEAEPDRDPVLLDIEEHAGELSGIVADGRIVIGLHQGYGDLTGAVELFLVSPNRQSLRRVGPVYIPDERDSPMIGATVLDGRLFALGQVVDGPSVIQAWRIEGETPLPLGRVIVPDAEAGFGNVHAHYARMTVSSAHVCMVINTELRVADASNCFNDLAPRTDLGPVP